MKDKVNRYRDKKSWTVCKVPGCTNRISRPDDELNPGGHRGAFGYEIVCDSCYYRMSPEHL